MCIRDSDRTWEERWVREEGYTKFIPEAVSGLLKKCNLGPQNIAKVGYPCLYVREHASMARRLGFEPGQIQKHMSDTLGDTGSAYPLILLVAALEDAATGDNIIVASFGSGSDALCFQTTDGLIGLQDKRKGVKHLLTSKKMLSSYGKYAAFRNVITVDRGPRGETVPWHQASLYWRNRREIVGLVGSRCKECGTPQYPRQRVCVNPACKAIDRMEDYRFSDKKGHVFTYAADNLAFSLNPPQIYAVVDFDGGGRFWFDMTDCEPDSLEAGMPVEMSFRRKFIDERRSIYSYCWKAIPARI